MIKLDASPSRTVVIVCDECPFWSAIALGMDEAHTTAVHHEKLYHPGILRARDAAKKWRRRQTSTLR